MIKKIFMVIVLVGIFGSLIFGILKINKIYIGKNDIINSVDMIDEKEPTKSKVKETKLEMLQKLTNSAPLTSAKEHLDIPTYIKDNNQSIHPSVFYDKTEKFGHKWIMAFTPYSYAKDETENPSVVVSDDGENWFVPNGLVNPIAKTTQPGKVHFSDTEIFSNGEEIEVWYRETNKIDKISRIVRRKSKDCVTWTKPEVLLDYGTGGFGYGAPSVVYKDGSYEVFFREHMSFNSEGYVKNTYKDGKFIHENQPLQFEYTDEFKDYRAWHIEVRKVEEKYVAIVMSFHKASISGGGLFLFTSDDGINFKDMKFLLGPGKEGYNDGTIYKSSLVVEDDFVNLYYSTISRRNECFISLIKITE